MDAFLNVTQKILAYGDKNVNSNPRLRYVDWNRDASGIPVSNPKTQSYSIAPGATQIVFDGTRATSIGGSSAFAVTLSPLDPSTYRFTWTGGTNPVFRTDRALSLSGIPVTFTVLANQTVTMQVPTPGNDFTGVVAGDTVFIPNVTTGDPANMISVLNSGYWQVLGVINNQTLSLARFPGSSFEATSETATPAVNAQLQAFSANGVQAGDSVDISAGFSLATRRTFQVTNVTSTFFEVVTTSPIATEVGITPGAAGMIFYTDSKSFLYVECDQEAAVRLNGSTDSSQRLSPIEPGNADRPGIYMKRGPSWNLSIVNRSSVTLNAVVIHAE